MSRCLGQKTCFHLILTIFCFLSNPPGDNLHIYIRRLNYLGTLKISKWVSRLCPAENLDKRDLKCSFALAVYMIDTQGLKIRWFFTPFSKSWQKCKNVHLTHLTFNVFFLGKHTVNASYYIARISSQIDFKNIRDNLSPVNIYNTWNLSPKKQEFWQLNSTISSLEWLFCYCKDLCVLNETVSS